METSDQASPRQGRRRTWILLLLAAGVGGWLAGTLLSSNARPTTETGYIVQQGDVEESNLGWHAVMVEDADSYDGSDRGDGFNLAGVWWRDVEGAWQQWAGPHDPTPECLSPQEPVRATIAYVNVRNRLDGMGGRRAVWLHCLEQAPDED